MLGWAVAGYREYIETGLAAPAAVTVATEDYQRSSDALARFLEECTMTNPHMYVTTADAFARWQVWAAQEGAEVLSLKAFGQALDRRGFPADPSRRRRRYGIGLLAEEEAP